MPDSTQRDAVPLGNVTTVQLRAHRYRPFLLRLIAATGDALALSELPVQDAEDAVYVIPKPIETTAREKAGWADDMGWSDALKTWGADAINILSIEAALRLMELGRIKGELTGIAGPSPISDVPARLKKNSALPPGFQGPFDWHLARCRVPQAWAMFASHESHQAALPWKEIRIGHIDTGYSEHAALGWLNGTSVTVHPDLGADFFDDDASPRDPFLPTGNPGHGTRISAVIAGFDPDAADGPYYGAAPGAAIIPYRVTDSVVIDHVARHVAHAIRDAIQRRCDVINISLGGLFPSHLLSDALDAAYEQGTIVICAAGNMWSEVIYPARYNRCVTMGGIGPGGKPWGGSAHGPYVDLCGPAQLVRRVHPENLPPGQTASGFDTCPNGSGTSYATAVCSGIAALWLAWHGKKILSTNYPEPWQRVAAFKRLLRMTAWKPDANWDGDAYGAGVVDAEALLRAALPGADTLLKAKAAADVFDPAD